jgi:hypothetical protein
VSWQSYGDFAFYAAAASAVLFPLLYLLTAPWWRTETGRNIMAVMGSLGVAMGYFAWVIARGGVPGSFYPVRALLFTAIAAAILWRVTLLVRTQLLLKPKEGNQNELEDAR